MAGWKDQSWSLYGGIQPTIFAGSMSLNLPTGVDTQGHVQYTTHTTQIRNEAVMFAAAQYQWRKQQDSVVASAALNDQGSYRVQLNYRKDF